MKILISGADSTLGRAVATALLRDDHEVVVRADAGGHAAPEQVGTTTRVAAMDDPAALAAAMHDVDAVVSLWSAHRRGPWIALPLAWRADDRRRLTASAALAEAASRAGVERLVHQGRSLLYADSGDDWVDEHTPVDVTRATEGLLVAETHVERFTARGGTGVSLRLGTVLGPESLTEWLVRRARQGRPTGVGDARGWMHVIHLDDVGTAISAALTAPAGTYNAGAEPVQRAELVDALAVAGDRRGGRFHHPVLTRLAGVDFEMFGRSQRVSSQRLADRTGWHPSQPKLVQEWFDGVG